MKKVLLIFCSVLLILASLAGIAAAGLGVKDGLAIKAYKEEDAKSADVVGELEEAIGLLKDNEQAYADGKLAYRQGLVDYAEGQKALAQGAKDLEDGRKQYAEGQKALEAGKAELAAGQAELDANTDAYNEGKELIGTIDPLMPYLEKYVDFRDNGVGPLPGVSSIDGFDTAQAWFVSVVRPLAGSLGLDIPEDVTDFPAYMQDMVADGKAQLKQYEDGQAALEAGKKEIAAGEKQLADAKKQLDAGEKAYADGKAELAAGAAALADGKAQLQEFEDGMVTVNEYTMICYKNEPIYRFDGEMAVPGPEQRLGEDYSWIKTDANGNEVLMRNGQPYLDLDKCLEVCSSFRASVDDQVADVTHELYMRLALYIALAIAGILGIIAGIRGFGGKGAVLGLVTALLLIGCNVFGYFTRYMGYTYPLKDGTYSGTIQLYALWGFAAVAIVFAIVAAICTKKKTPAAV